MRILIAEDDELSRTLVTELLRLAGHEVVEARNGWEAWDAMKGDDAPAMAILDWMMPEMDGMEVLRRIRLLPAELPVYVIMLTGRTGKADIVEALEAGANDFLAKPFDSGEFRTRVQVGIKTVLLQQELRHQKTEIEIQNLELRKTRDELDAARRRYRDLYNEAPVGYVSLDGSQAIRDANRTASQMLGWAVEDLVGKPLRSYVYSGDAEVLEQMWGRLQREGTSGLCRLRMSRLDGIHLWCALSATRELRSGIVSESRIVFHDITREVLNEKEIANLRLRLSQSEQDERQRIANLLSERTAQDLVAIQMGLSQAMALLGDREPHVGKLLADCCVLAERNAGELRSLSYDLHAPWLQHGGLLSGIRALVAEVARRSGLDVALEMPDVLPRLPASNEIVLYNVLRECLMNIQRGGEAKRAWIILSVSDRNLLMTIRDDSGTPATLITNGSDGCQSISLPDRMNVIGGRLQICPTQTGPALQASLPIPEEQFLSVQP